MKEITINDMQASDYLTTEKISDNIHKDNNNYLLCTDVILARTGTQTYYGAELGYDDDPKGVYTVNRTSEEVFSEETIKSFENKPLTDNHPTEMVTPKNHKTLSKGVIRNVRKANYTDKHGNELLICDVIAQDEGIIEKIVSKIKRQVSAGYTSFVELVDKAKKVCNIRNIRGNHLALVERGRAGTALINDSDIEKDDVTIIGGDDMSKKDNKIEHKFQLEDSDTIYVVENVESKEEAKGYVMDYLKTLEKEEK